MVARETVARWMAVGRSNLDDPFAAGREAASEALAGGDDPRLLIVSVRVARKRRPAV